MSEKTAGGRTIRRAIAGSVRLALAGVLTAGALFGGTTMAHADTTVEMPDPALLACVNEHLDPARPATQAVTVEELAEFTDQLRCGNRGISDLTGLEHATGVWYLALHSNAIDDITPLGALHDLVYIGLGRNLITDIGPLSGLGELQSLYLSNNRVSDVTPLSHIGEWSELDLSGNAIADISPLHGYDFAVHVDFWNQRVTASAIAGVPVANPIVGADGAPVVPQSSDSYDPATNSFLFTEESSSHEETWTRAFNLPLGFVWFTGTLEWQVSAPSAVEIPDPELRACINNALGQPDDSEITSEQLTSLTDLDCDWYEIADLTGIEHAVGLERLILSWNLDIGLSEQGIAPLAGLTRLVELDLELTNISDLSPLAGLTALEILDLGSNIFDDGQLEHLSALNRLQVLVLSDNYYITDLTPLAGLTELRELYAQFTPITSAEPLRNLDELEVLYLNYGTAITDISPLAGLTNLRELALDDQEVRLPDTVTGAAETNPVRNLDGTPIPSYSEFYDPATDTFRFPTQGQDVQTGWETEVTIGGATATFSGVLTRDVVDETFTPVATIAPEELNQSEMRGTGVRITGTGFPGNSAPITLYVDGEAQATGTANAEGEVVFDYTAQTIDVGVHQVRLTSGELTAEAEFTVTADPAPVYDPRVTASPFSLTQNELARTGVALLGTGFPESEVITVTIDGVTYDTGVTDADGAVRFLVTSTSLAPGTHTAVMSAVDVAGEATFTVIASTTPSPGDGEDQEDDDHQRGNGDAGDLLAATGNGATWLLVTAGVLCVFLGVMILRIRRQRA